MPLRPAERVAPLRVGTSPALRLEARALAGIATTRPLCASRKHHGHQHQHAFPAGAPDRLRNIGIAAHIDHGKTTLTERMLLYSGILDDTGEVHDGDATMDYMDQERERGITIQSAAITFNWGDAQVNLIDTPGHVDFTMEVERSMRVLDGAVLLVDAVSGVQAQTETVWRQTQQHKVPVLIFVNKMDRDGASLKTTLQSIRDRLHVTPLLLQVPLGVWGSFRGVVDLITLDAYTWPPSGPTDTDKGRTFKITPWSAALEDSSGTARQDRRSHDPLTARAALLEHIADLDDEFAEVFLAADAVTDDPRAVEPQHVYSALRRITLAQQELRAVPVLLGSALRNKGVQPLLDAVVRFLPSPCDRPSVFARRADAHDEAAGKLVEIPPPPKRRPGHAEPKGGDSELCALAFKIQNDARRGPLVFVRVYQGTMHARDAIWNSTQGQKERIALMARPAADSVTPLEELHAGDIGMLVGLRHTKTGDTLSHPQRAKPKAKKGKAADGSAASDAPLLLPGIKVLPAVFAAALELDSLAQQKDLAVALDIMTRDDPSLRVTEDEETGQLLLSGMGELHLDVALDRLRREHKLNVSLGRMRVAYRESLTAPCSAVAQFDKTIGATRHVATLGLRLEPHPEGYSVPCDVYPQRRLRSAAPLDSLSRDTASSTGTDEDDPDALVDRLNAQLSGDANVEGTPGKDEEEWYELSAELDDAIREGVLATLSKGPLLDYPMTGVRVVIDEDKTIVTEAATPLAVRRAAAKAIVEALRESGTDAVLLEPVALMEVVVPEKAVGAVLSDLSAHRRAAVQNVGRGNADEQGAGEEGAVSEESPWDKVIITALVPLAELMGYSTALRSVTGGEGTFQMAFDRYEVVGASELRRIRDME